MARWLGSSQLIPGCSVLSSKKSFLHFSISSTFQVEWKRTHFKDKIYHLYKRVDLVGSRGSFLHLKGQDQSLSNLLSVKTFKLWFFPVAFFVKWYIKFTNHGAAAIAQRVEHLFYTWLTWVLLVASYMDPKIQSGMIPECRGKRNPWAQSVWLKNKNDIHQPSSMIYLINISQINSSVVHS